MVCATAVAELHVQNAAAVIIVLWRAPYADVFTALH
jgi:hypothetical protein